MNDRLPEYKPQVKLLKSMQVNVQAVLRYFYINTEVKNAQQEKKRAVFQCDTLFAAR